MQFYFISCGFISLLFLQNHFKNKDILSCKRRSVIFFFIPLIHCLYCFFLYLPGSIKSQEHLEMRTTSRQFILVLKCAWLVESHGENFLIFTFPGYDKQPGICRRKGNSILLGPNRRGRIVYLVLTQIYIKKTAKLKKC